MIILVLPHNHDAQVLRIRYGMPQQEQISIYRNISFSGNMLFYLLHMHIIKAGEYDIPKYASAIRIASILWSQKQKMCCITIVPGQSTKQIWELIKAHPDLTGLMPVNPPSEGSMIADTYQFAFGTKRTDLIQVIIKHAQAIQKEIWTKRANNLWANENDWITCASLLEKEGYDYEDKRMIAGVIMNRLRLKMSLQIDATLVFLKTKGYYNDKITWDEVRNRRFINDCHYNSPYNTYTYRGLPPGPITNPSKESLEAALNPIKSDFLYYRLVNGKHIFAKTFTQHKNNAPKLISR